MTVCASETDSNKLGALVLAMLCVFFWQTPASAKLGEDFNIFQNRIVMNFKARGQEARQGRTDYHFTMMLDQATQKAAPGFEGGLTVTVENNLITGQSMLIRLGTNREAGKALAALHALDFAFESLGRPSPKTRREVQRELQSYTAAVTKALAGTPQNIRYADTQGKITISKRPDGSIALAATFN